MIDESDLLRFIEGECTPEEAIAIQRWLSADPRRAELLEELRAVWRLTGDATRDWKVPEARRRLLEARNHTSGPRGLELVPGSRKYAATPSWSAAWPLRIAVAIGLAVAGAAFWALHTREAPSREYATAAGQRSELTLSDGSRVVLGVATRLRVPGDYGARERAVELEGEAYFIVRHDARRPFMVRTRHGTTEDLGTEFDVRAYPEEAELRVVVAAGSVAIRPAGGTGAVALTLRPRDLALIDARGEATVTTGVTLENHIAWIRGRLVFDDAPLRAVVAQLERWYDLDMQADPALDDERLTISFTTESPDEALAALAKVLNVRVTRAGRSVRLVSVSSRQ